PSAEPRQRPPGPPKRQAPPTVKTAIQRKQAMWLRFGVLLSIGLLAFLPASPFLHADSNPVPASGKPTEKLSFSQHVAPLLNRYCIRCHGSKRPRGGVILESFKDEASAIKAPELWDAVL